MPIIEVKNVTHYYGDSVPPALSGVSFTVEEGEFVALVGRNGSGKSTVAKLLNGLIIPSSGDVVSAGINTRDEERIFDVRKTVGVVFQNPDNQMVATIIEDDVAFGPENLGILPKEIEERVDFALSAVGMLEHKKGTPTRLSGGQKQRIAIAGILAMKPRVLVLDESTSMLDPQGRRGLMEVVKSLNKNEGITVIMITHYMDEAALCDRIILLDEGKVRCEGGREIFNNQKLIQDAGLEVPIAVEITAKLKEKGLPLQGQPIFPEEVMVSLQGIFNDGEDIGKDD